MSEEQRQIIKINSNNFCDLEGFYDEIDRVMTKDLDWKTGHNLDAFNDLLRGGFGVHNYEEPITIIWVNSEKSKDELGYEATIRHYERMLSLCHPDNRLRINKYLERAKQYEGETLFDILLDIIKDHHHIELRLA